jgi:putative MATE family efflux protein
LNKASVSSGEKGAAQRDWTKGGILRNVLLLSWPLLTLEGAYISGQTLEMVWVGKLGAASMAGVGAGSLIVVILESILMGFVTGSRAIIARFAGAGNLAERNHAAGQSLLLSGTFGLITSVLGMLFSGPVIRLLGFEPDVVSEAVAYLEVTFLGWTLLCGWRTVFSIMQASGDTITPMKMELTIRSIHVALCPFLVLGWWGFPFMGVRGAALSNAIAEVLGLCIGLWIFFTGGTRVRLTVKDFLPRMSTLLRILKIGLPACVMRIQRIFADVILMWLMVPFGTVAVAAHSVSLRVQQVIFMTPVAFGNGTAVVVGQNLGAGQPDRAMRSGWLTLGLIQCLMIACSATLFLWAENIVSLFNREAELVALTAVFLRIAAAGYLVVAFIYILQSCISGAGDTVPPMVISLGMIWLVQIPLAYLLPLVTDLGVYGVRWAIVVGMVAGAAAYAVYFRSGKWTRKWFWG